MTEKAASMITALEAENARLRAIVERLPKTADGVVCLPNDRIVFKDGDWIEVTVMRCGDGWCAVCDQDEYCPDVHQCYSTREAAEEAPL